MGDTFISLRNQLNFKLGNRTDPAAASGVGFAEMLPIWVNNSYVDLGTKVRLPELEETATMDVLSTDTDHPRYLLPIDYYFLIYVRDNTHGKVPDKLTIRELRDKNSTANDDRFTHFALWRAEIILDPPLTATAGTITLQIDYRKRPTKFVNDTDTSILPDEWDEIIVQGAEYRALNDMAMKQEAAQAKALYNAHIAERLDRLGGEMMADLDMTSVADKVNR
jgi:hypothetical protein